MFSLWTRPTIPFKLQCESETIKQDIASKISEYSQITNGILTHEGEPLGQKYIANLGFFLIFAVSTGISMFIFSLMGDCNDYTGRVFNACQAIAICLHAYLLLWLLLFWNKPLLELPGKSREAT